MTRVLFITEFYRPGFRAGPIQAVGNVVDRLGDRFAFSVIAGDRDAAQDQPYEGIAVNQWQRVGAADVMYLSPDHWSMRHLRAATREARPDVICLTSALAPLAVKMLTLRHAGQLPPARWVIAPHGELTPGAMAVKSWKKRPFLGLMLPLGFYRDVVWQAGSELERREIADVLGDAVPIVIAPLLPETARPAAPVPPPPKSPGTVSFIYLSRITPKKNLRFAIEQLSAAAGDITLDIVGPIDDPDYWTSCLDAAKRAPRLRLRHVGDAPYERVLEEIGRRHVLLMPTFSENFGYVILESLRAARPVLISDQTPWRGLQADRAGWDLPLGDLAAWQRAIAECVQMDDARFRERCEGAARRAAAYIDDPAHDAANAAVFSRR